MRNSDRTVALLKKVFSVVRHNYIFVNLSELALQSKARSRLRLYFSFKCISMKIKSSVS